MTTRPEIFTDRLGQYSPWFEVPSDLPDVVPKECHVTFAQVLSRHGARDPTCEQPRVFFAQDDTRLTDL